VAQVRVVLRAGFGLGLSDWWMVMTAAWLAYDVVNIIGESWWWLRFEMDEDNGDRLRFWWWLRFRHFWATSVGFGSVGAQ
jgi:hypothetical protein